MTRFELTCDLGNSRLKVRLWDPRDPEPRLRLEVDAARAAGEPDTLGLGTGLEELEVELARELGRPESAGAELACALSSVAGAARTGVVATWLAALGPLTTAPPITNTCRHPETVGADRLFAARGALDLAGESCLVVDAGTALTVDAARLDALGPAFLGGAIAPGPALLAQALASGGARLSRVDARPGAPALGRETREALEAGITVGLRGAARELVQRVAAEAELEGAPVYLTGGARAFLLEPDPVADFRVEPELVHRGLRAALRP